MNDSASRLMLKLVLLVAVGTGCAQEGAGGQDSRSSKQVDPQAVEPASGVDDRHTILQGSGGEILVFVPVSGKNGQASLIAMSDGDTELKYRRIMRILREVNAGTGFIEKIGPRLKNNRRLTRDNFTLPLIDEKGNEHHFEYTADMENHLYTLNYEFRAVAE